MTETTTALMVLNNDTNIIDCIDSLSYSLGFIKTSSRKSYWYESALFWADTIMRRIRLDRYEVVL